MYIIFFTCCAKAVALVPNNSYNFVTSSRAGYRNIQEHVILILIRDYTLHSTGNLVTENLAVDDQPARVSTGNLYFS